MILYCQMHSSWSYSRLIWKNIYKTSLIYINTTSDMLYTSKNLLQYRWNHCIALILILYPIIPGLSIFWGPMEKFTLSIAHHRFESRAYNSRSRWRYPRITMWCSFYCYLRYHIKYINQIIKISIKLNNCYFYIE